MAAPSGAIRAGRAFVEMFADPSKLNQALDGAKRRVLAFGQFAGRIGLSAVALGTAALGPITKLFSEAVSEGAGVDRMAKKWDVAAESVSALQGAFAAAGVGADEFESIIDGLNSKINDATTNSEQLWRAFSAPRGIDLFGKAPQEQLEAVFAAFEKVNKTDQLDVAKQLGMEKLLPYLRQGLPGLRELDRLQNEMFKGWSKEDAQDAATVMKEFDWTMNAVKSTLLEVGKALLPTGGSFASFGTDIRSALDTAREWIASHRKVIAAATAVAAGFVLAGFAISGIGAAALAVIPALTALKISLAVVNALLTPLIGAFGGAALAGVVLAAAIGLVWARTEQGKTALAELKTAFGEFAEWVKGSWKGIMDALSVGNWTLAFEIGIATADAAWKGFVLGIQFAWNEFKATFVDGWRDIVTGIQVALIDMASFILGNLSEAMKKMIQIYNSNPLLPKKLEIDTRGIKSKDQIEAEFNKDREKAINDRAKQQAESDKARGKSLGIVEQAFVDALQHLEDLKRRAAEEAKDSGKPWGGGGDWSFEEKALPTTSALSELAKGTYGSSSIQQALGYGDNVGQRQLDALRNVGDQVAESNTLLKVIADKPNGITVK